MELIQGEADRTFRDLPIRQKLLVVMMVTVTAGLVLAGAGIIGADSLLFHDYLERDLSTLSRIIADNSTAALEFDEPRAAGETLSALRERPHIVGACIYRKDGTVLATYVRAGGTAHCSPPERNFQVKSTGDEITVSQPILLKGDRVGTLVFRYELGEVTERFRLYGTTVLGVLFISSAAAFLLSSRLRAIIATPISQLARAASSVSATKDYSIRAEKHSADELGLLVDAFNEMLAGIQSRDSDLTTALMERESALREARDTRDFLHTTLASIGDAVISTDVSGLTIFANPVALALMGRAEPEATGKPVDEIFRMIRESGRDPVLSPAAQVLRQGVPVGMTDRTLLISSDGTEIPIEYSAAPIRAHDGEIAGAVLVSRDVTERHKAEQERVRHSQERLATEERLREAAKLESLGILAGGIAHDFNNLLVGVLGNASLAQEMLPASSPVLPIIENVINASEKAAQLTHQMLAYSGKGRFIIELVDLSRTVEDILPLISRPIPKSVSIQLNLAQDLPVIEADRTQLQQILMNLVINAAEACGTSAGSVFITTKKCELNANEIPPSFGLSAVQAGTFICLEIRDTGAGMSEEVKTKMFDPFFTTKFTGRGLGLSAALGIIRSHKGAIEVESTPGTGTSFRIFFPAVAGKQHVDRPVVRQTGRDQAKGFVLVVDDEEVVRIMAKMALEKNGYGVVLAEDGEIGVEKFKEFRDRLSIVILDLTMPVMDGESALKQIRRIDPLVKVVLSSGFDERELAERFKGKGLSGFLQKPYTARKLVSEVKAAFGDGVNGDSGAVQPNRG